MAAFTKEQEEILLAALNHMLNTFKMLLRTQMVMSDGRFITEMTALKRLLIRNGLATRDNLIDALKEVEAEVAVEEALDSEFQAAFDEFNRQIKEIFGDETRGKQ